MSTQTEDTRQIGWQTLPSSDVAVGKRPPKHWLGLAIALIAAVALLASGIWSRVKARNTLDAETAQSALTAVVGCVAQTNCARGRNRPSGQCATIHHFTYLRAYERLSEEVVFRYWRARQAGTTACRDRNAGSRSATAASPQQPA